MRRLAWAACLLVASCVTERVKAPEGLGSFRVSLVAVTPFTKSAACAAAPDVGTSACPRPFPTPDSNATVRIRAEALDRRGEPYALNCPSCVQIDVRPGRIAGVGPTGLKLSFVNGVSDDIDIPILYAGGPTRIWIEDCGTSAAPGTFASGISPEIVFDSPTLSQLNETTDNTTSPLEPRADNVCAITGDPRFGLGADEETGQVGFVGYSHGREVNAPPAAIGSYVDLMGCDRATYDAGTCTRGPLVVTGVDNAGFFVTDLHPDAIAAGFNHLYAFNFNYPDDLQVGDIVVRLRGSPMEFTGSTQLRNPTWQRDGVGLGDDLLPPPMTIAASDYESSVRTYGRNEESIMTLERLEGALVCMDNIAPASAFELCDKNLSGDVERGECELDAALCATLAAQESAECGLTSYLPANPAEYCCERLCYNNLACSEESAFVGFGQWVGDVFGRYEATDSDPVKMAFITRDANPDFDPTAFGAAERAKATAERQHLRIVGNLRQVLAARPTWVVIARQPSDIAIQEIEGGCP